MLNITMARLVAIAALLVGQSVAFKSDTISSRQRQIGHSLVRGNSPLSLSQPRRTAGPFASCEQSSRTSLRMSDQNTETKSSLPVFLDPGTKGGAIVLSVILFVVPLVVYNVATGPMGMDEIEVGRNIGVGFSVLSMVFWLGSYIFRVATKDMTYAKQLKDYEDAVIAKRLEELDEDEVQALVEDIEREQF